MIDSKDKINFKSPVRVFGRVLVWPRRSFTSKDTSLISFVIYKLDKSVGSWAELGIRKWPVLAGAGRYSLESRKEKRGAPGVLIPRYQRRCAVSAAATPGCLVVFPPRTARIETSFLWTRFHGAGWVVTSFAIARQSP